MKHLAIALLFATAFAWRPASLYSQYLQKGRLVLGGSASYSVSSLDGLIYLSADDAANHGWTPLNDNSPYGSGAMANLYATIALNHRFSVGALFAASTSSMSSRYWPYAANDVGPESRTFHVQQISFAPILAADLDSGFWGLHLFARLGPGVSYITNASLYRTRKVWQWDRPDAPVETSSTDELPLSRRWMLALMSDVGLYFPLSNNWTLETGLSGIQGLTPIRSNEGSDAKLSSVGIAIGMKYIVR